MFAHIKLRRCFKKFYKNNNSIVIITKDEKRIVNPKYVKKLKIHAGKNNHIEIHEPFDFGHGLNILLTDNTEIVIDSGAKMNGKNHIRKSRGITHNFVHIGKNFSCGNNCKIDITDNGNITIGDDAKWSWDIYVKSDDTHPIFSTEDGKILNKSTEIKIGSHVWICMNVCILKNSHIPNNCIIGAHSLVSGKFYEENSILAGNPARIVRKNVDWAHGSVVDYCAANP